MSSRSITPAPAAYGFAIAAPDPWVLTNPSAASKSLMPTGAPGVTPPRLPVGGAKFVRAHPRVSPGSALLTGWPRSRESAPLAVRRMQMTRHDHRQRSDRLGVRHASSADRRAGRGNVHEARIAVDFSESPGEDGDSG